MSFGAALALAHLVFILNLDVLLGVGVGNPLEKALIVLAGLVLVVRRPRIGFVLWGMAALVGIALFSAIFTRNPNFSWSIFGLSLNQIAAPLLLLAARPTAGDRDVVLRIAAWTPVVSLLLGVVYGLVGLHEVITHSWETQTARLQGSLIPAFFGGFAMTGAIAAVIRADGGRRAYLWLAGLNLILLVASGARMAAVIGIVICGVALLTRFRGANMFKLVVVLGSLVGAVVVLGSVGTGLIERFAEQSMSGRSVMWAFLQHVLDEHWAFGVGLGHQMLVVPRAVWIETGSAAAHNEYLRMAVELGVLPAGLFFAILVGTLLALWARVYRCDPVLLVGIGGFLALSITDNALAMMPYFGLLIVTAYGARCKPGRADLGVVIEGAR